MLIGSNRSFPDTVSTVMHRRRQKAPSRPSAAAAPVHNLAATQLGLVNNSERGQKFIGSFASGPVRSQLARSARAHTRSPADPEASVLKSERTPSQEDPVSGRPWT